jgi:hypothetical protein
MLAEMAMPSVGVIIIGILDPGVWIVKDAKCVPGRHMLH